MIMKYIEPIDPSGLVVNVLNNIFMQLSLPAFHTRTINDLLWGYEDIQLAQAIGLLTSVAKFAIPSLHVDFPKRLAYVVSCRFLRCATIYICISKKVYTDQASLGKSFVMTHNMFLNLKIYFSGQYSRKHALCTI